MTKPNPFYRAAATAAAATGACALALACPAVAMAASGSGKSEGSGESTPLNLGSSAGSTHTSGSGASIVRTIVGLAIVIAVIWGLSWILRQVKAGREPHSPSTGLMNVAALTLTSGRSVHLVKAGNDYLLLGSAEHGVMPLHRYSEEEAREAGLLDVIEAGPPRGRARIPSKRALLRPPSAGSLPPGGSASEGTGHDPMSMPSPGPGTSLLDRLRELTVRR
jgi:flagellar protein FliO/FliZ